MNIIENLLNKITMYRLVLYYLILLIVVALFYSFFKILPFTPISLLISTLIILGVCLGTNWIFAKVFNAPTNIESVYITALILVLIITPVKSLSDLPLPIWAGVLSMASKYILAINKKHIFNPVAVAVVLTAFGFNGSASWWVGTLSMVPFELLGFLIVVKTRRYDMIFYFFLTSYLAIIFYNFSSIANLVNVLKDLLFYSAILFFAFIMLTEPLTTPPTKKLQSVYGALVGVLFIPQFHVAGFYTTPEIALLIGNIFSYLVSPKFKVITNIKEVIRTSSNSLDIVFNPLRKMKFLPGQYMEWTYPHDHPDGRGNRRYFTIASSPTENDARLGLKLYPESSSYKKAILANKSGIPLIGAQLGGDFTMPSSKKKRLIFIAGGIGITPFRSMIKFLIDKKEVRSIVLFYSNKTFDEIIYKNVFDQAVNELGIKVIYTLTDQTKIPLNWQGKTGRINEDMIRSEVPDFNDRTFYISGSNSMVEVFDKILHNMGVKNKNIKKDFFPGL